MAISQILCRESLPVTEILSHARKFNSIWYWTGRKCKNGHISFRYTSNRNCVDCHRDLNKIHMRGLRLTDHDRVLKAERKSRAKRRNNLGEKKYKLLNRRYNLKHCHNLSLKEYDQMLNEQDGVCAICRKADVKRHLHVDHDHSTNKIRGLLCCICNNSMKSIDDDENWGSKAKKYKELYGRLIS